MKTLLALALVLTPLLSTAEEFSPALTFSYSKIESGPLSLLDAAKQAMPPLFGKAPLPQFIAERHAQRPRRASSNMPIITPQNNVEYKLRIATPDDTVDYKLTVKAPELESSK
jgi:hypothetical protein